VVRAVNSVAAELVAGLLLLMAGLAATTMLVPAAGAGLALSLAIYVAMAVWVWRTSKLNGSLGWPNRVTLLRGLLLAWLAVWLMFPAWLSAGAWTIVAVALGSLVLDGVDGWLARRLGQATVFGARFDMEVDAALILLLCLLLVQAGLAGPWVLLIGLMRYGFLAITACWPALRQALPDSQRRKVICVWQVASLVIAFVPGLPAALIQAALALALALLVWSFALDMNWLMTHRADARKSH
jgi:phosphatidylglycerophosphate synthase